MTDARFPERWLNDRRILRLPDDAFRLFVNSLAWSAANRTDGRIYDDDLPLIPGSGPVEVGRDLRPASGPERHLAKSGLWARVSDYWLITVFEDTQTGSAELERMADKRRAERDKKRRQRAAKRGDVPGDVPGDATRTGQDRPGKGAPKAEPPTDVRGEGEARAPGELDGELRSRPEPEHRPEPEQDSWHEPEEAHAVSHAVSGDASHGPEPEGGDDDGPFPF